MVWGRGTVPKFVTTEGTEAHRVEAESQKAQEGRRQFSTAATQQLQLQNAEPDSRVHSRAEIYFSYYVPQERRGGGDSGVVWRRGWKALRDDDKRYGQGEAHPE